MINEAKKRKKDLIEKLRETNDEKVIEEVYRLLQITFDEEPYSTTKAQRVAVSEARDQIKNGQTISDTEANKEVDRWLNR